LRDRALLSGAENRLIDRLGYAFLIAAPFLLTDFRAVWAHPPARLGALGLLIALAALQASDGGARRAYFGLLALRLVAGALFGLAIAVMAGQTDAVALVRFAAVACAFALTLAMAGEALQQAFATRAPGVFSALAAADVTTREAFVAALEAHPAFSGLAALGPSELVDYDPQMLAGALEEGEVIGARALRGLAAPIRERLEALLAARQATHALVLSKAPLRLMTLAAPGVAVDPALDEALPVLGRLAARLPEKGASGDI
jgi:hypothetical protein